jgi:hypothetical protein
MKNGFHRFTFYTQQVQVLLEKARDQKDPTQWLFDNYARTPFFMLEGLSRLYADIHNPKKFNKLKNHFKLIEDGLGKIDYYTWLLKAFEANKKIPAKCTQYTRSQLQRSLEQLNEELRNKGWLATDEKRLKKINKRLESADWIKPIKEVKAISEIYKSSAADINSFVIKNNYHFDNVEEDVHELRRKLRWLSIYPQALQGLVQYSDDIETVPHLNKYLTNEIINSSFNKLPAAGNNTSVILLQKNYFLALSWMIAQLGKLKDEGLLLTGLSEAMNQGTVSGEDKILLKAVTLIGSEQRNMQSILNDAETITKTFFKENNLKHLISK